MVVVVEDAVVVAPGVVVEELVEEAGSVVVEVGPGSVVVGSPAVEQAAPIRAEARSRARARTAGESSRAPSL